MMRNRACERATAAQVLRPQEKFGTLREGKASAEATSLHQSSPDFACYRLAPADPGGLGKLQI